MLSQFRKKLSHLCSRIRWLIWRRPKSKVVIRRFGKLSSKGQLRRKPSNLAVRRKNDLMGGALLQKSVRVATFNAALFSLALAVPRAEKAVVFLNEDDLFTTMEKSANNVPKSILKQSPLHSSFSGTASPEYLLSPIKPKMKVSINLPDNEISLAQKKVLGKIDEPSRPIRQGSVRNQGPMRSPVNIPFGMTNWMNDGSLIGSRTILDVLKEVDADILALQDVKAEEEKNMKPLSDLAYALGMNYVFAESWAPEYGNAILSKWPIKRWKVQRIYDDQDFRNVLKATIDVPWTGDINFYCTQLDHLDESWRLKQINAIIQSSDHPHILAGGLNSLNISDYSPERWADIVRYYQAIGKPTPKVEVTNFLKGEEYIDAKDFSGDCEPVVMIAKGQNVQGTCKYGTRVDYIMASQDLHYKFVPETYSVISSKGTSDHHLVKVDIVKAADRRPKKLTQKVARIASSCSSSGMWKID
ncbi:hypothetical protein DCAR_0832435 [Daucus carota subsp. sativus]|uniref:Endonuclease/exonuclease/phosphatase domain-containing protein n=1 Tax=Daucus carota subsp. sativus TaxID=79200 RepID=A0A175YPC2_DAUCS|nr:PREDICTED: uncharacterized protein LOC108197821 [Daucus carota subsp. sativus]WOH12926.1 hypothetical protein DCAR_0832435 [Daucus carota subsp. sativus]